MVCSRESATLKPSGDEPRGRDIPQILRPGRPRIGPLSLAGAERERWTCSAKTPVNRPPSTRTRLPDRQSSVFMCHGEPSAMAKPLPNTSTPWYQPVEAIELARRSAKASAGVR